MNNTNIITCAKRRKLTGRSMLEMLGVLAIIGVLSVLAINGYNYAIAKHKANEIIDNEQLLAFVVTHQLDAGHKININEVKTPYTVTAEKVNDKAFGIYISDLPERVCKILLQNAPKGVKMAVNDVFYSDNTDICQNSNVVQFYHNLNDEDEDADDDKDCLPDFGSHCTATQLTDGNCICTACEVGYTLNAGECEEEELTCPPNASVDGDGEPTDVDGCNCDADTPKWSGNECRAENCADRLIAATLAGGWGVEEELKAAITNLNSDNIEYTGNIEIRSDANLSGCSLTVNGYFWLEDAKMDVDSITVTTKTNNIALGLRGNTTLNVKGDIRASSAKHQGLFNQNGTITAQNIFIPSAQNTGVYNNGGSITVSGKIEANSTSDVGIFNNATIMAGEVVAIGQKRGISNEGSGVLKATGNITASSKTTHAITSGNTAIIESKNGSITGVAESDSANGLNLSNTTALKASSGIYYCPAMWKATTATVDPAATCSGECNRGNCVCSATDPNCETMARQNGECICTKCKEGSSFDENNICQRTTCYDNSSAGGTGDQTALENCKCNADAPLWNGSACVADTCANRAIKAMVNSNYGTAETLEPKFKSLISSDMEFTGNMEFKTDVDLSACSLTIDGYYYLENAEMQLKSLHTSTTENSKIAANFLNAKLTVTGDIYAYSKTNFAFDINNTTVSASNITAVSDKAAFRSTKNSVLNASGKLSATANNGIAIQNDTGTITINGDILATSEKSTGILNRASITSTNGTITGICSSKSTAGLSLISGSMNAKAIYYCPSMTGSAYSTTPEKSATCE